MNKFLLYILLSNAFLASFIKAAEAAFIPRTSYYVWHNTHTVSPSVTFHTFDGEIITQLAIDSSKRANNKASLQNTMSAEMDKKLDPKSPRPQPIKYKIIDSKPMRVGLIFKKTEGGHHILFYDKFGNVIRTFVYDKKDKAIVDFKLEPSGKIEVIKYSTVNGLNKIPNFPLDLSKLTVDTRESKIKNSELKSKL